MKTNTKSLLFLAAAAVTVLNFQSCGKYEDGPGFSLRTKKARLTGEWELVKINGQTPEQALGYSSGYSVDVSWEIESDGDLSTTTNISYGGQSYSYSQTGEWEFSSNKEDLEITIDGSKEELEILQLKNKESKFKTKTGTTIEYEFEKK
jgi:hypothetical protein